MIINDVYRKMLREASLISLSMPLILHRETEKNHKDLVRYKITISVFHLT